MVWGHHTVEAYSNRGLTRVLYATDFRSFLWTHLFILRKPRVWFAFFVVILICLVHNRLSAMVTPKYFATETLPSSTLCRMYLVFKGFAFFVIWRTCYLEGLNCISHIFSYCSRHARSVCRTSLSVVELIASLSLALSQIANCVIFGCSSRLVLLQAGLNLATSQILDFDVDL